MVSFKAQPFYVGCIASIAVSIYNVCHCVHPSTCMLYRLQNDLEGGSTRTRSAPVLHTPFVALCSTLWSWNSTGPVFLVASSRGCPYKSARILTKMSQGCYEENGPVSLGRLADIVHLNGIGKNTGAVSNFNIPGSVYATLCVNNRWVFLFFLCWKKWLLWKYIHAFVKAAVIMPWNVVFYQEIRNLLIILL